MIQRFISAILLIVPFPLIAQRIQVEHPSVAAFGGMPQQNATRVLVQLLSPADGATLSSDTIRFRWYRAPGALRYRFLISPDSSFTKNVLNDSSLTDTTRFMTGVPRNQPIYWKAAARDTDGWGPFSTRWSFRVGSAPPFSQTPLTEMGQGLYNGFEGGLYPGATNVRPAAHDSAGRTIGNAIVPLDTAGNVNRASGNIVLLSIGMSNTTQEFSAFFSLADTFRLKNPNLTIVDGAQGGQTASIIRDPAANFWNVLLQRLRQKNVSAQQVQCIWLKEANAGPTQGFPAYAQQLEADLRAVIQLLPSKYPNVKLVYLSSRIYAGYASSSLNPEPYAFESGLTVKWLIGKQIAGDTGLTYSGSSPKAPWLAWGPYLWANGTTPRIADGLTWVQSDFQSDGTHPAASGQQKVARMLLAFFSHDSTAIPWFLKNTATTVERTPPFPSMAITIFPQPARDSFTLFFAADTPGEASIELFNSLGVRVGRWKGDPPNGGIGKFTLSLQDTPLRSGIYLLRILAPGFIGTTRVILLDK